MDFEQNTMNLEQISRIRTGYSFRGGVINDPEGNIYALQMRDLTDKYTSIKDMPYKVRVTNNEKNHLLNYGDILLVSKGANNKAVVFDKDYPAIASSTFFIITIKQEFNGIDPYYLSLYINSSFGQSYIKNNLKGTTVPNLLLQDLLQLSIIVPPVKTQKQIVKLFNLHKKETELLKELITQKEIFIENLFATLVTGKFRSIEDLNEDGIIDEGEKEAHYYVGKEIKSFENLFDIKRTKEDDEFLFKYGNMTFDEVLKELEKAIKKDNTEEENKVINNWFIKKGNPFFKDVYKLGEWAAFDKLKNKK